MAESDVIQAASQAVEANVGPGEPSSLAASGAGVASAGLASAAEVPAGPPAHEHAAATGAPPPAASQPPPLAASPAAPAGVVPSAQCTCSGGGSSGGNGGMVSNVFAIGIVNYDYGTKAESDAMRMAMDPIDDTGLTARRHPRKSL